MAAVLAALLLGITLLAGPTPAPAEAAEVKVLSTVGMQPATPELFAQFEAATGHKVIVTYGLAAVLKNSVLAGAQADVLILTAATIDELVSRGKVVAETKIDVARSGVGSPSRWVLPSLTSARRDAEGRSAGARSIGYSREGASGVAFARAVERLGITDQVKAKYKDTGTKAGEMLAAGEIDLAAAQIPELLAVRVSRCRAAPRRVADDDDLLGRPGRRGKEPGAGTALIEFLAGPRAAPVYKAKGLGG